LGWVADYVDCGEEHIFCIDNEGIEIGSVWYPWFSIDVIDAKPDWNWLMDYLSEWDGFDPDNWDETKHHDLIYEIMISYPYNFVDILNGLGGEV
jgi:hypothetical protein